MNRFLEIYLADTPHRRNAEHFGGGSEQVLRKRRREMLEGKVALVTGAGRGIGREIALTLAGYGADVIVNYNGSKEKAEEVVSQIEAMGRKAVAVQCSVADFEACGQMITDMLAEFGHIDILVNNAGITRDNLVIKMTEEDFDAVIDTNLKGTFNTIKHMYRPFLKQRAGRIINLSSVSGVLGNAGQANYSASKAGVIGLTKSLARELASRNITVNAVAPGFIDTDMTQAMTDAAKQATLEQIPLKRVGTPKDIAEAVAFLASDRASYITGQVLSVDGGMAI
jgi:3-oxoacyl-[acyl-carrier protein] reductase